MNTKIGTQSLHALAAEKTRTEERGANETAPSPPTRSAMDSVE